MKYGAIESDIQRMIVSYLGDDGAMTEGNLIEMIRSTGMTIDLERFRCAVERMVARWQLSREYDDDMVNVICQLTNKKTELAKWKKTQRNIEFISPARRSSL